MFRAGHIAFCDHRGTERHPESKSCDLEKCLIKNQALRGEPQPRSVPMLDDLALGSVRGNRWIGELRGSGANRAARFPQALETEEQHAVDEAERLIELFLGRHLALFPVQDHVAHSANLDKQVEFCA